MYQIQNEHLKVNIKHKGAELSSIKSVKSNTEFIWQADPDIWGSHSPNLFPIIGTMKDDSYYYNSKLYKMPKHGFVRHNENFEVKDHTKNHICFKLNSNPYLYALYPFNFELLITYELNDNVLHKHHTVKNQDDKDLFFSIGGHPAFNCPLHQDETYTDYILEFEKPEHSKSYLLEMSSGLVTDKTKHVFTSTNQIQLKPDLFDEDALIFKDLISRKVILKHKTKGRVLRVNFNDFPFLGIWAKPNAPYVCIEPWIGIADAESTNQQLIEKEGIVALKARNEFNASYSIEIDKSHLI